MKCGDHHLKNQIVEDAGWHFSYMNRIKNLLMKIQGNRVLYSNKHIQNLRQGKFLDCNLRIETIGENHPKELQDYPHLWNQLLIQNNSFIELASQMETYFAHYEAKER